MSNRSSPFARPKSSPNAQALDDFKLNSNGIQNNSNSNSKLSKTYLELKKNTKKLTDKIKNSISIPARSKGKTNSMALPMLSHLTPISLTNSNMNPASMGIGLSARESAMLFAPIDVEKLTYTPNRARMTPAEQKMDDILNQMIKSMSELDMMWEPQTKVVYVERAIAEQDNAAIRPKMNRTKSNDSIPGVDETIQVQRSISQDTFTHENEESESHSPSQSEATKKGMKVRTLSADDANIKQSRFRDFGLKKFEERFDIFRKFKPSSVGLAGLRHHVMSKPRVTSDIQLNQNSTNKRSNSMDVGARRRRNRSAVGPASMINRNLQKLKLRKSQQTPRFSLKNMTRDFDPKKGFVYTLKIPVDPDQIKKHQLWMDQLQGKQSRSNKPSIDSPNQVKFGRENKIHTFDFTDAVNRGSPGTVGLSSPTVGTGSDANVKQESPLLESPSAILERSSSDSDDDPLLNPSQLQELALTDDLQFKRELEMSLNMQMTDYSGYQIRDQDSTTNEGLENIIPEAVENMSLFESENYQDGTHGHSFRYSKGSDAEMNDSMNGLDALDVEVDESNFSEIESPTAAALNQHPSKRNSVSGFSGWFNYAGFE